MALIGFGEVTTSGESQLEDLRLRGEWKSSRMERPLVGMRSQGIFFASEVVVKLLNGIKTMYLDSSVCVRVSGYK